MSNPIATTEQIAALPEKMRAHAAAKALEITSKELLAALAAVGVEIKSAQSAVTREQLTGLVPPAPAEKPARAPRKRAPKKTAPAAEQTTPETTPSAEAEATESTAEKPARTRTRSSRSVRSGADATGETDDAAPAAPTFSIVTGEVGTAEENRGRRRRGGQAAPTFSPLFLSADDQATPDSPSEASPSDDPSPSADSGVDTDDDQSGQDGGSRRRGRRGRRGRGRGRGDDQRDESTRGDDEGAGGTDEAPSASDEETVDSTGSADSGDDRSDNSDGGSRRRRRRRRRGGGGDGDGDGESQGSNDDPPNTEIHEREPRRRSNRGGQGSSLDEVQGISGSTRLEAKRQRRRDGREAGRKRQPILSESEFLARRESVDRVMVVREKPRGDGPGTMTQVGVLEDKVLVEHFVTTESARSMVGNVYLGRVQNVLPSMEAAFVDIGRGRNGVLYAGEVNWQAAGLGGRARRIEQALKPGDMVLVQVTKDPVGQKGARLTTQISLAGRFLVYVPDGNSTGISRKLPDTERRRLKAILKEVVPEGAGVIIRTAAEGVSEEEIGRDVERLATQWSDISDAAETRSSSGAGSPVTLYEEPDLLVKVVRDLFNEDFSKLVIQGGKSWTTVHDYVSRVAPDMLERLERFEETDGVDVFAVHRIDEQLAKALDRKVWLPSGGTLVIDRTEAMTVVDVNTGKFTGSGGNLEETLTKNNLEAAEEIVRQLRLRDIGGMVIVDFIDMVLESNRDLVLRRLTEALGRDRTRHQVSEVTSLGLVQLTRKKLGTGLVEAFSTPCERCQGRGIIVHADPVHTESHNADEPGGKRTRKKRGGSAPSEQSVAPKRNGPVPSAHPAVLAMHRHDEPEGGTDESAVGVAASVPESDQSTSGRISGDVEEAVTVEGATRDADTGGSDEKESSGRRRRRSSRRSTQPAGEPRSDGASEISVEEAPSGADAVSEPADGNGTVTPETVSPVEPPASAVGRRPRRRAAHKPAGIPGTTEADAQPPTAVVSDIVPTALAEAPTAVGSEPRRRPARRRATRTASGGPQ